MDKLRQKLQLPKAKTFHSGDFKSLDTMVKESMYFVWPVAASVQDDASSPGSSENEPSDGSGEDKVRHGQRGKLEKQNAVLSKHDGMLPRFVLQRDGTSVEEPLDSDEER